MSKKCGKCEKTVYPTEELKCLDKVWHKGCFKCQVCNMTLNMKNYKGYDKQPYCNAHYPKTKHTVVADTPEQRRIAENTKNQSAIKYHEDFERSKGKYISVPDDPETQRVRKNMQTISNVAYHGVLHQRDEQERMRPAEQVEGASGQQYTQKGRYYTNQPPQPYQPPAAQQPYNPPQPQAPSHRGKGMMCKAMYDYSAADTDEVTFCDGDVIINCNPIDQGWMEGTVERTGKRGMLPSNYVERVN